MHGKTITFDMIINIINKFSSESWKNDIITKWMYGKIITFDMMMNIIDNFSSESWRNDIVTKWMNNNPVIGHKTIIAISKKFSSDSWKKGIFTKWNTFNKRNGIKLTIDILLNITNEFHNSDATVENDLMEITFIDEKANDTSSLLTILSATESEKKKINLTTIWVKFLVKNSNKINIVTLTDILKLCKTDLEQLKMIKIIYPVTIPITTDEDIVKIISLFKNSENHENLRNFLLGKEVVLIPEEKKSAFEITSNQIRLGDTVISKQSWGALQIDMGGIQLVMNGSCPYPMEFGENRVTWTKNANGTFTVIINDTATIIL
ncbi:MAG: hypothetical protein Edafosvirus11_9 [Edafosvirus sp.]|uniref:Uncharacterized protein n=1 Tax=Edafosvirus sp. TaxID=2487765 RepID=A0A3G4ZVK4_9VIRU|nr:MAG: hypothetical protein Edafosvirus11_9 [Edafosvirus sp.]